LPDGFDFDSDVLGHLLASEVVSRDVLGEMIGKRVGALVVLDKVLHISYVLLRSDLYKLLGVSAIALVGVEAFTLVYDNLLSALSSEWAEIGVLTVAWAVHEVCRQEVLVQFGVEVSLEEFTEVGVATVGHRYSEPGERWESFLNLSDDGMNRYGAEVTVGGFEVDGMFAVSFSSLLKCCRSRIVLGSFDTFFLLAEGGDVEVFEEAGIRKSLLEVLRVELV